MASRYTIVHPDLKDLTFTIVTDGFAEREEAKKLTVSNADPEDWGELPMVAINLVSDTQTNSHIGSSLDDELIEEEDQVYAGMGAIFSQVVEVTLWTTNKEQRDRLGKALKEVLFVFGLGTSINPGLFVTTPGVAEVRITGGQDQGIVDTSQQYAPHALFLRTYYVNAITELTAQEPAGQPIDESVVSAVAVLGEPFVEPISVGPSL